MVKAKLFVEGGASGPGSKLLQSQCREGFRKLLEKCGFQGVMPAIIACGSRNNAYRDFCIAHNSNHRNVMALLLVDSEEPVADIEKTWEHLSNRDQWAILKGATDEQVYLMTTSMEAWIICDRQTLMDYYGQEFQVNSLLPQNGLEQRSRQSTLESLNNASKMCKKPYSKGKNSFQLLQRLDPKVLIQYLPSFARMLRELNIQLLPKKANNSNP